MYCESAAYAVSLRRERFWLDRMSKRRFLAIAVITVVVVGGAAAVWSQIQRPQQIRPGGRGGFAGDGPVPVIAAVSSRADVPVYLDGVGTVRALNTVTVRAQVEGKLIEVAFKEGQDVKRGQVLARIDPDHLPGAARSGGRQEGAGRGDAGQRQDRSRALHAAGGDQLGRAPAARHAEGDGRAARGAGEARPGGDRQRPRHPAVHHHRRADRRPHRHPPGRRGQHRARLGCDRHRRAHAASADLGAVHAAAAAARRRHPRDGQGRCRRSRCSAPTTRR